MATGFDGLKRDYGQEVIALNASGAGQRAVTFAEEFTSPPFVDVVPDRADVAAGATYRVVPGPITVTGCVIEIVGSKATSADKRVIWQAHEYVGS